MYFSYISSPFPKQTLEYIVLPYLYFWIFDKCDYAYALNRLLDYFSKLRNVILLLTSINCRKSTMINNVTNRVDFFFVQRDNHIILFLYINIERGVLVVFQLWQRFLVFLQDLFRFPFYRTHFRFQVLAAKIEYVSVFS